MVVRLEGLVAEQAERIVELEKALGESRRSGKRQAAPFSKGQPSTDPAKPGGKPGGAHGRHGHRRAPVNADRIVDAGLAACCPDCGGDVALEPIADQWQVDLPEQPAPVVTRFRVAVGSCGGCGRRVQGSHRDQTSDALGAAGSQVGRTAKGWAAWLHDSLGLSFAKCSALLGRLGVEVTAGALCSGAQTMGTAVVPVRNTIAERVNGADMVVMDETGWRVDGLSAWLWVATTADATVYDVAEGRGFDQACGLVDADYPGVIVRDGWAPYRRYETADHQTCLAHLLRRCHHMVEDLPAWARGTPRHVAGILTDALDARDLPAAERATVAADLAERMELTCEGPQVHDDCRRLVGHLTNKANALFTFLTHDPAVDATNWRGEQAIRPAVVNRKVWGGNRTWRGAATQSQLMTVLPTTAQQGIDPIEFLARYTRAPAPTAATLFT